MDKKARKRFLFIMAFLFILMSSHLITGSVMRRFSDTNFPEIVNIVIAALLVISGACTLAAFYFERKEEKKSKQESNGAED